MKAQFFGDSYDIVKQSFIRWLSGLGAWAAHPMFTEKPDSSIRDGLQVLLGCPLVSMEVLEHGVVRNQYFAPARDCLGHLFLDPDTGVRLQPIGGAKAFSYLFGEELVEIAQARPGSLTLVFDQSYGHGADTNAVMTKLQFLERRGLVASAYVSHAHFLLVANEERLARRAHSILRSGSGLPASRFLLTWTEDPEASSERAGGC